MSEVTQILASIQQGNSEAAEELLPLVYEELRKLAAARMAKEPETSTLQPTALVHEAWLRLAGSEQQSWKNRGHFFAAAAEAMRRILIDNARRKKALKRGAGPTRLDLDNVDLAVEADEELLLGINDALEKLALQDPQSVELVKLRFFVGLTENETAEVLQISPRTVERYWSYAKAWLFENARDSGT